MQRLLVVLLGFSLLAVACGSSGDEAVPTATGTETSQRAERQASVLTQDEQQDVAVADASTQAAEQAQGAQQIDALQEDSADEQVVVLPVEIVGEHKGIRSERNVLGDPESAVEIHYYGDFT